MVVVVDVVDVDVVVLELYSEATVSLFVVTAISRTISSGRLVEISVKSLPLSLHLVKRLLLKTNAYEMIETASIMIKLDIKLIIDFAIDKL